FQTELLGLQHDERVLEIGTGSGYQAAVLSQLGARVFSVERHASILAQANEVLEKLGYRVRTLHGDGTRGWPSLAPFDAVIVTAGGTTVPRALLEQLRPPQEGRPDARLVIPVGGRDTQTMRRITRIGEGTGPADFRDESFGDFRFVPLVGDE
ncbi:MAG TPA: methyltransferase domain-containing protein, partial [Rhodothermales bacterium]|nr:methyltransferase domain-containing protein [Rhodothermales bacterium]